MLLLVVKERGYVERMRGGVGMKMVSLEVNRWVRSGGRKGGMMGGRGKNILNKVYKGG